MREIGQIHQLQIQTEPLKIHIDGVRTYRATPIQSVEYLILEPKGITGISFTGEQITDVHHEDHPQTRFRGDNSISVGLRSNYDKMQAKFGDHIKLGAGGENIIIELLADAPDFNDLSDVYAGSSPDEVIRLMDVIPAPPCREFSIFCADRELSGQEVKSTIQFLSNGVRGFYMKVAEPDERIQLSLKCGLWIP